MRPALLLLALVIAFVAARPGAALEGTVRASIDNGGNQLDGASGSTTYPPSLAAGANIVAFESRAAVGDGDTNGNADIFVRDIDAEQIVRASVSTAGQQGNNRSYGPSISGDGRLVAFESLASNLVDGDTNTVTDVFLHDTRTGETTRVSTGPGGAEGNGASTRPAISDDGRFIAFCSRASNIVEGDDNDVPDAFVLAPTTGLIARIAVPGTTAQVGEGCSHVALSSDGRFVAISALVSEGGRLVSRVFRAEREVGAAVLASVGASGEAADASSGQNGIAISGDGLIVAFDSVASNLVEGDDNGATDVFVRDMAAGTTTRVSVSNEGGQGSGDSGLTGVAVSGDGRYVVFASEASELMPGDANRASDVFRYDREAGQIALVSVALGGQAAANGPSYGPDISSDGATVSFASLASNAAVADRNRQPDVFVRGGTFPDRAGPDVPAPTPGEDDGLGAKPVIEPRGDDGPSSTVVIGGAAGAAVLLLAASWFLLGRRPKS